MPNEGEGNDSGQRDQATKGWHNQGRQGRNQCRQGNRGADQQRGRGASPGSKATSTIGRGSERPNSTSEQLERSAPTPESYTPSTWQTSQQL